MTLLFFCFANYTDSIMERRKELIAMVLFITLLLITAILVVLTVAIVSVTGAVGIVLFSDVIVCVFILIWLIKKFFNKKRRK